MDLCAVTQVVAVKLRHFGAVKQRLNRIRLVKLLPRRGWALFYGAGHEVEHLRGLVAPRDLEFKLLSVIVH